MLNQCNFIGRLGRDPETRFTQAGDAVCNFSIATDYGYGDKKKTEWVNIVAFKKTAELCQQYLNKGKQVYISGRMQTRKWQDKDGSDRYTTEIIANEVKFLSGGDSQESRQQRTNNGAPPNFDDMDDDIPFAPIDSRLP